MATNLLLHFSDLYCDHLLLSKRSLGGCIGSGGRILEALFCIRTGRFLDRHYIEHLFILSLGHIVLSVVV